MIDEYANRRKFCVSIFAFSAPAVKAAERSTWLSKTWASLCIRDCKCRYHVLFLWLWRCRPWITHSDSKVFMFWIAVVCSVQSIQIPWNFPSEEERTIKPSDLCSLAKVSWFQYVLIWWARVSCSSCNSFSILSADFSNEDTAFRNGLKS